MIERDALRAARDELARTLLKYQDYRFSVAPMMDWSESSSFSIA